MKGLRSGVWRTRDITIGGKNPTSINFASIGNQIQFIDTIKYFQQSLRGLASRLTDKEREGIYRECEKFLLSDSVLSKRFISCTKGEKKWVLDYLSSAKGTIPYELIIDFDSLNIVSDKEFFLPHQFHLSMKDSVLSEEEYQNVKNFYMTLKLQNLGELNHIYNFQDTIILCEIFEQRSSRLLEIFKYNPRKCNSASSFSGCVHRNKSKCCIALPTNAEHVRVFEKTLIGGFSCVNTRLAFDTEVLINKNENEKVIFDLLIDGKKQTKRISSKIIKMDENNQYGIPITKPLP